METLQPPPSTTRELSCPRCGAPLHVRWISVDDERAGRLHLVLVDCAGCAARATLSEPQLARWLAQAVCQQLSATD